MWGVWMLRASRACRTRAHTHTGARAQQAGCQQTEDCVGEVGNKAKRLKERDELVGDDVDPHHTNKKKTQNERKQKGGGGYRRRISS